MPRECAIESIRKSDERRTGIVVKKRVRNDGSSQQRWLPDIVKRIFVEILDMAMSNVIRGMPSMATAILARLRPGASERAM